ncbi:MAG: LamG domain-containing protein, partial [Euryarchaeota archaeon]|nr:LamG domain-containing protein [Euryarchaeota archaeon]
EVVRQKGDKVGNMIRISVTCLIALCLLAALVLAGTAAGEVSREWLVAEYHFDGDAKDASGNGHDGTIYGASFVEGKFGQAMGFDGVDDYVDAGNGAGLDITDAITVEAWVKPITLGGWKRILQKCNVAVIRESYCLVLKDGTEKVRWELFTGGTHRYVDSNQNLPSDRWTHIVGSYDGQVMRIYFNGNLDTSSDYGNNMKIGTNNLDLYIGSSIDDPRYFSGTIDEVRIYNRALSAEEIKQHYEGKQTSLTLTKSASPTSVKLPTAELWGISWLRRLRLH